MAVGAACGEETFTFQRVQVPLCQGQVPLRDSGTLYSLPCKTPSRSLALTSWGLTCFVTKPLWLKLSLLRPRLRGIRPHGSYSC